MRGGVIEKRMSDGGRRFWWVLERAENQHGGVSTLDMQKFPLFQSKATWLCSYGPLRAYTHQSHAACSEARNHSQMQELEP